MALTIETTIARHGPAAAIELTDAQVVELGGGKRAPVLVTIDGQTARLRLAVMGGKNLIGLSKASRAELGVAIGDRVTACIDLDTAPREVPIPEDLAAALDADPQVRRTFDALPYTHRKEYARAVDDAKRADTRARRIEQTVAQLRED